MIDDAGQAVADGNDGRGGVEDLSVSINPTLLLRLRLRAKVTVLLISSDMPCP